MRAIQRRLLERVLNQVVSNAQQLEQGLVSAASHSVPSCSSVSTPAFHALSLRFFSNHANGRAPQVLQQHLSTMLRASLRQVTQQRPVYLTPTRAPPIRTDSVPAAAVICQRRAPIPQGYAHKQHTNTSHAVTNVSRQALSGSTPRASTRLAAPTTRPRPARPRAQARRMPPRPSCSTCNKLP